MGFRPTQEMIEVRRVARRLYDQGLRLVGEWCSKIPSLTPKVWKCWERLDGFMDWWTELFPEHGNVTLSDLQALEFEANKTLMNALAGGDLQAVGMVIKMMGLRSASAVSDESGLEDWFTPDADGDWIPPIAKA